MAATSPRSVVPSNHAVQDESQRQRALGFARLIWNRFMCYCNAEVATPRDFAGLAAIAGDQIQKIDDLHGLFDRREHSERIELIKKFEKDMSNQKPLFDVLIHYPIRIYSDMGLPQDKSDEKLSSLTWYYSTLIVSIVVFKDAMICLQTADKGNWQNLAFRNLEDDLLNVMQRPITSHPVVDRQNTVETWQAALQYVAIRMIALDTHLLHDMIQRTTSFTRAKALEILTQFVHSSRPELHQLGQAFLDHFREARHLAPNIGDRRGLQERNLFQNIRSAKEVLAFWDPSLEEKQTTAADQAKADMTAEELTELAKERALAAEARADATATEKVLEGSYRYDVGGLLALTTAYRPDPRHPPRAKNLHAHFGELPILFEALLQYPNKLAPETAGEDVIVKQDVHRYFVVLIATAYVAESVLKWERLPRHLPDFCEILKARMIEKALASKTLHSPSSLAENTIRSSLIEMMEKMIALLIILMLKTVRTRRIGIMATLLDSSDQDVRHLAIALHRVIAKIPNPPLSTNAHARPS